MGLKIASGMALTALFALMYAIVFVIGVWFLPSGIIGLVFMLAFTMGIVFFQYLISPVIIKWIYRIQWYSFEQYQAQFPHLADIVSKVCELRGLKYPKLGIIHDLNPNAFCFGWTKNKSKMVITDGILKHLNKKEQEGVVAHEMGHIVHSDFILMTIVFAIPLVLLTIARWSFYTARFSTMKDRDDDAQSIAAALFAVAVLSYVAYYVGYMISLIVSRIREYYADEHAAEVTEDPNCLATALVKIAYGLVANQGKDIKDRDRSRVRGLKGMGIFDPSSARGIAASSVGASGKFSKDAVQAAAAWDLFNPWAKYYQFLSTHPLPAKRILRLNDQCDTYGKKPELDFSKAKKIKEEQAGKSMFPEFMTDVTIKELPTIVLVIIGLFTVMWILGITMLVPIFAPLANINLLALWGAGLFLVGIGVIIRTQFMYKKNFKKKKLVELIMNVKVSPIRCVPAIVKATIIGQGVPGYYFSEDLYIQDDTALMYVDYRWGFGLMDFFFALRHAKKLVGQSVKITGWYRRGPSPYLQVKSIETESGRRFKNHSKGFSYIWAVIAFIVGGFLLYLWLGSIGIVPPLL